MSGITFDLSDGAGTTGSVTVPLPRRFYRRWAIRLALWLWTWGTES